MDIKIDSAGDLVIEDGDLVLVDGIEAIAQHIRIRLRFFRGEWFIDQRLGIPFYQSILVKNPNLDIVRAILREAIIETPGVVSVPRLDVELDASSRTLKVTAGVIVEDGNLDFTDELV